MKPKRGFLIHLYEDDISFIDKVKGLTSRNEWIRRLILAEIERLKNDKK